jgi:hypothetical protein
VGSGKTSFAMALITAVVRLHAKDPSVGASASTAPFGCLWVVEQMPKADVMYRELSKLLAGQGGRVVHGSHIECKHPTKVLQPAARFAKDDLQHYPVAIVTHAFFGGNKARRVLHEGKLRPRALTVIDERPEEVTVFDIEYSAAERVRERVKADHQHTETVGLQMDALVSFMFPRTFGGGSVEKPTDEQKAWEAADGLQWFATAEASAFIRDNHGIPDVEAVFGFAKALAQSYAFIARVGGEQRGGPGCLNNFSASISGASAGVKLPSGAAAS